MNQGSPAATSTEAAKAPDRAAGPRTAKGRKSRALIAAKAGIVLLAGFLMLGCVERALVFPAGNWEGDNWDLGQFTFPVEEVWLTTDDGVRIHGWWRSPREEGKPVVLYLHGNSGNITHRVGRLEIFGRLNWGFLIIDYRGYGRSEGRPSEKGLYRDAEAAWAFLTAEKGIDPKRVALFGVSLGSGVASEMAVRHKPGWVILEAPFASINAMAREILGLPIGFLLSSKFDNLAKAPSLKPPLLVIHGDADEVVPFAQGEQVYAAAKSPKEFYAIVGGGHNNLPQVAGLEYFRRFAAFLGEELPPPPGQ